ncbi:hypothetical protein IWZ01DRAFT_562461, partial [Phyllosticta capitalensis]
SHRKELVITSFTLLCLRLPFSSSLPLYLLHQTPPQAPANQAFPSPSSSTTIRTMVKPAEMSSNTPIRQRAHERDDHSSPSSSDFGSSPASYHYSTKLRCLPPGAPTSPESSPTPSPAASPAPSQSQFQSPHRVSTPPPHFNDGQEQPSTPARSATDTDSSDEEDDNGRNDAANARLDYTTSTTRIKTGDASPIKTAQIEAGEEDEGEGNEAPAASPRFHPRTPPQRPLNPLAKEKTFLDPSPLGSRTRPRLTQEQLEALRGRGLFGAALIDAVGPCMEDDGEEHEDGDKLEEIAEEEEQDGDDEMSGALQPLSLTAPATTTAPTPPTSPTRATSPHATPTATSASINLVSDSPTANSANTSTLHPSSPHNHTHTRNASTSSTIYAALRANAKAAYEAARAARAAAPEDEDVKAAYQEARAAYDGARRAFANAVLDEEDEEEEERKRGSAGGEGRDVDADEDMEKGQPHGEGRLEEEDQIEALPVPRAGTRAAPPSPTPPEAKKKRKQKQKARMSPLERIERSVRRMKANRAI